MRHFYHRSGVVDDKLHGVTTAPRIAAKMAGEVEPPSLRLGDETADRSLRGAEGDRTERAAAKRVDYPQPQMPAADGLDELHPDGRKRKARLGVGGAERRQGV